MTAKTEIPSKFEDMKTKAIIVLSSLLIGIGGSQGVGAFSGDTDRGDCSKVTADLRLHVVTDSIDQYHTSESIKVVIATLEKINVKLDTLNNRSLANIYRRGR